jgi:hypothetical protein
MNYKLVPDSARVTLFTPQTTLKKPLRTDPTPFYLKGQWAYRQFLCLAKAARANPQGEEALSLSSQSLSPLCEDINSNIDAGDASYLMDGKCNLD